MKLNKYFLIGTIAVAGLSSCVSEDLGNGAEKTEKGRMTLDVSLLNPRSTRAEEAETETAKFPVSIVEKTSGEEVKTYETVLDVPKYVVLPVGHYTVKSHTPGNLEKKMTAPYYAGEEEMEIVKDLTTQTEVVCKMQNSSITVKYDGSFTAKFTEWAITLDDGSETALSYTDEEGTDPAVVYWLFGERVSELKLNITAKTADNKTITHKASIRKSDASESYDDDEDIYFKGGDALVFNFKAVASAEGTVTGIEVTAQETFFEDEEEIVKDLEVTDKTGENQGGGDEEDPTPGEDEAITFDCPELADGVTFSTSDEELPQTTVIINTPNGLKSMKITIIAGNEAFEEMTEMFKDMEMIGNEDLEAIFGGIEDADATVPVEGQKVYSFPVFAFFGILQEIGSTAPDAHQFHIVVEDNEGNVADTTLKVTITE